MFVQKSLLILFISWGSEEGKVNLWGCRGGKGRELVFLVGL